MNNLINSKGLQNLGNTCFFNSVLQLLFQCTVLNKLLVENEINGKLIDIYKRYLNSVTNSSTDSVINPHEIVHYVSKILGRNTWSQEDADQYITFIIDCLINEFKEWSKTSTSKLTVANKKISLDELINSLFTISCEKELFCPECNYISKTNDDLNKLYLSMDSVDLVNTNLSNLINKYLNETLDFENMWKCDKCNQMVPATIKRIINKLPKYLIITLKRYANNNKKIDTEIDMPLQFSCMNKNFYLRGFIYHSGSTGGGHYMYYGNKNDNWFLYNDSSVSKINADTLENVRKVGYIYLYVSK